MFIHGNNNIKTSLEVLTENQYNEIKPLSNHIKARSIRDKNTMEQVHTLYVRLGYASCCFHCRGDVGRMYNDLTRLINEYENK